MPFVSFIIWLHKPGLEIEGRNQPLNLEVDIMIRIHPGHKIDLPS